jgi:MFS family permease
VAMMLGGLNYRCLVTALPIYLRGESGAANQEFKLALMVFLALVAGGIGQISGGWASDRFGARRVYPVMLAFLVPFALLLGTLDSSAIAPLVACAVAIFLFAQQPVENSLLAEWTSSRRRSVSYGTKFALTFGVGALGTQVAGLIWYQFDSMAPVFYVIAGSAFLMGLLSWYAARRRALTEQPRVLLEPLPAPAAAIAARAPQELESQMMT